MPSAKGALQLFNEGRIPLAQIRHALTTKRADDFAAWYQEVIGAADMAEESGVRGCMVIKPWGYGIWERLQRLLDDRIKETGHDNAYFPCSSRLPISSARPSMSTASPRKWRSSPITA